MTDKTVDIDDECDDPVKGSGDFLGSLFGGGSQKQETSTRTPVEAANTLRSVSTARVLDLISEGEIVGLVDGLKSVYFDNVPLVDSNGKVNFPGVQIDTRSGLPDQTPMPGFSAVEAELLSSATQVVHATSIVHNVTDTNADRARPTARIPSLWAKDATTGDVNPTSLQILIEVKPVVGPYVTVINEIIQGKCVSTYEKAWSVPLDGNGPWSIRMTRVTADYDDINATGSLYWSGLTSIVDHRLIYPDSAIIGVTCDAQSFGGRVPTRSYLIDGLITQVPTNYDPVARTYTGIWDGTFKLAHHSNPAWVLWDLEVNNRYGLGDIVGDLLSDKWTLYEIAQYCDGMVPDGLGGMEPRYTFNGVISSRDEAIRVLMTVASVFRGMVHWSSGAVMASADMPSDPVKAVTQANVIDGIFNYQGQARKAQHSVVLVTWNDPSDSYRENIEVVEDPDLIDLLGYKPAEIRAIGCTSRGQARRYGKWLLDTEKYEGEVVNYTASWDHADLKPGDIISLTDPAYIGLALGGRTLAGATTSFITLDRNITLNPAVLYTLQIALPNGSLGVANIANAPGITNTLTLTSPLPDVPLKNAIWLVTSSAVSTRPFRVVAIVERGRNKFEVTGVVSSPGKYDRVELDLMVEDPDYTALPTGPLIQPIGSIGVSQYLYEIGSTVLGALTISWNKSADPRVLRYEVQVARKGLDFSRQQGGGVFGDTSIDINGIARTETDIQIRVRSLDDLGRYSDWLTSDLIPMTMFTAAPPDVQNLHGSSLGDTMLLTWDAVNSRNVDHYEVKFSSSTSGATWGSAQSVASNVKGTSASIPAKEGTALVKAISLSGVESQNEALFVTGAGISQFNAVQTVDPTPTWPGTKTNTHVSTGFLVLDSGQTDGSYLFTGYTDLGQVYTSRVSVLTTVFGLNVSAFMSGWPDLTTLLSMSGVDPSQWSILIEEQHTTDDPAGSPTWSAWREFSVSDITARAYKFRVSLHSDVVGITPVIETFVITIDMPDRLVTEKNVASGTSSLGKQLVFTPAFHSLKGITISYTTSVTGDYYEWLSKDETQATIRFKNAAGTVVSRNFDYTAVGYGSKV